MEAIASIDLIALACIIISLGHMLIDLLASAASSPSSTAFARPLPLTVETTVRRREQPADFAGYCTATSTRGIKPLPRMVLKGPLRQSIGRVLMVNDHARFLIESNAAVMVDMV